MAIGAPGNVTLPRADEPWPAGLANAVDLCAEAIDLTTGSWPDILLFVGDRDVSTEMLDQDDAANRMGATRVERARTLHRAWKSASIPHE